MPSGKLTAGQVERARPGATLREVRDSEGLTLRILPSGAKTWSLRYRVKETGERKRITLGTYPALSLSKAREAAVKTIAAVVDGKDPSEEKKATRATAQRQRLETLVALADRYFEVAVKGRHRGGNAKPKRPRTLALERYYWRRFVEPGFGKRPIRSITRADIEPFVNEQDAPSTRRGIKVVFQRLFAYARWLGMTDADPVRLVQVEPHNSRERVLTAPELRALWQVLGDPEALERLKIGRARVIGVALCAITLQRRGEVAGIDLAEIDLAAKTWTLPAHRAKNGRAHIVPLPNDAIELIKEAMSLRTIEPGRAEANPLFPTVKGAVKAIDVSTLTRAFIAIARAAKLADARLHDLRRTGATFMTSERIGIPRFIVSRVLNHASDKGDAAAVTAVYDRNAYLPEKRKALDNWAALLREIVSDEARHSNVVALKGQQ
jgi:integrase